MQNNIQYVYAQYTRNEGKACKQLIQMHSRHSYAAWVRSCTNFVHSARACSTQYAPRAPTPLAGLHHLIISDQYGWLALFIATKCGTNMVMHAEIRQKKNSGKHACSSTHHCMEWLRDGVAISKISDPQTPR